MVHLSLKWVKSVSYLKFDLKSFMALIIFLSYIVFSLIVSHLFIFLFSKAILILQYLFISQL